MSEKITLYIGYTSVCIKIEKFDEKLFYAIKQFCYNLTDYIFDRKARRYVKDKNYYLGVTTGINKYQDLLFIPRNYLDDLKEHLKNNHIKYKEDVVEVIPKKEIDIELKSHWILREDQIPAVDFLINNPFSIRCLALSTGLGKSFTSVATSTKNKQPFLIITSGLVKQWYNNVLEQTTLTKDDVYVIKGADSILKIIDNDLHPTCVIASLETIRNFAQNKKEYRDFPFNLQMLCKHLNIGIKIVDECHENFHAIVSIDLVVNIEINLYLSATYIRNNQSTHKIFNKVFPIESRYGEGNYEKYIDVKMFQYSSYVPSKYVNIGGTYSHFNYEKYLLKHERGVHWFVNHLLKRAIEERYISIKKPGEKLLILMATVDNILKVVSKLELLYPDLTVLPFTAKHDEDNLNADIIVSTIGSSGTGRDIPNLVSALLTVSIKSEGQVRQIMGRLRKLKHSQVYFTDIYNEQSEAHIRHKEEREKLYILYGQNYCEGKL